MTPRPANRAAALSSSLPAAPVLSAGEPVPVADGDPAPPVGTEPPVAEAMVVARVVPLPEAEAEMVPADPYPEAVAVADAVIETLVATQSR